MQGMEQGYTLYNSTGQSVADKVQYSRLLSKYSQREGKYRTVDKGGKF